MKILIKRFEAFWLKFLQGLFLNVQLFASHFVLM